MSTATITAPKKSAKKSDDVAVVSPVTDAPRRGNVAQELLNRAVGYVICNIIDSSMNNNPDDSFPRVSVDGYHSPSGVSLKAKLRILTGLKNGPVWLEAMRKFDLDPDQFHVLEQPDRDTAVINRWIEEGTLAHHCVDVRLFGCTYLLKNDKAHNFTRTGPVQFGVGRSVAPVNIETQTWTKRAPVDEEKSRGMAPMAFKVVSHAVVVMPFFINPTVAIETETTKQDIEFLKFLLKYAYTHTSSVARNNVQIISIPFVDLGNPLGSVPDHLISQALTPTKIADPLTPSRSLSEYNLPTSLPDDLLKRLKAAGGSFTNLAE